ncbi:MAG: glycosyltransferase family 4 protein [Bacteroidetes bacterium]|nr:glycosyltransferase family 4 protein [Bacteroidota bacterium]
MGLNKVSLFNFFNTVSLSNKPWVVTFENEIPKPYLRSKYLVKRLKHKSCKKIIAFCDRAKNIEIYLLDKYPEYKQVIVDKLIVLQPAQALNIQSVAEKEYSQSIVFSFVGVDFFRKGGAEILRATEKLIAEGYDFKLNIVSQLKKGAWKDEHITAADIENVKEIIQQNPDVITHYYSLNAEQVISLFKQSHVGLLPSYGETYGYVVLEAQACGCAVITSDMPPFPEFNDNQFGWLINVPLIERNGTLDSNLSGEHLALFQDALYLGLYNAMKEAIENKDLLKEKAQKAIEHIRKDHSPEKRAKTLEEIYISALQ